MQLGGEYIKGKAVPGAISLAGVTALPLEKDPQDGKGALLAWDPVHQKARWRVPHSTIWNGGTLATAGGLVFQGTADGYFTAYDASSGKAVWRFNAGLGIIAAPISYEVAGKQYVSLLAGYGGMVSAWGHIMNVGWKYGAQPRRLLTFALGGKATLPPSPPPDLKVHALDDPALKIEEADVQAGQALAVRCVACHGLNLQSAGSPGPDLRESQIALHEDDLWNILHEGTLMERGMPRFEMFTREQVHQIYVYIRASAREVLGTRKPATGSAGASHL